MPNLTPEARDLIVRVMLGEDGDSPEGMTGVAHVIRNRLNSGFANTAHVGPVIRAAGQFASVGGKIFNSASPNDPKYQQAAAIADSVFDGQTPDNTGGATSFYAPGKMAPPNWAQGQGLKVGNQLFYKVPMSAALVGGGGGTGPSSAPDTSSGVAGFVMGGGTPANPTGIDLDHVEPLFKARINQLMADAAAAGIKTHIVSGYRDNAKQKTLHDAYVNGTGGIAAAPGTSYHNFGRAVDIIADNPAQQSALSDMAEQPGRNIFTGRHFGDYDHYEAIEGKTAPLVGPGVIATRNANEPARQPDASNLPAPSVQPATATAPGSSGGRFAAPPGSSSAGFVGPGSDKYSVVQGMTTGTSHNPQLTTAANWGNLFGGAATPAAPPSAPAAAPSSSSQPASAPAFDPKNPPLPPERPAAPIDTNNPLPWRAPPDTGPASSTAPAAAASTPAPAPASAAAIIAAPTPTDPDSPANNPLPWRASGPGHYPVWGPPHAGGTATGPIIAHPWDRPVDAPQPPQAPPDAPPSTPPVAHPWDAPMSMNQPANLPGSMFASAQNLLKLLFPSQTG